VDAWVEKQLEVFTSGNYGTTYDLTKIIMDNFEEYKVQLAANQQVRLFSAGFLCWNCRHVIVWRSQVLSLNPVSPDVQPFLDAALARVQQCEEVAAQYLTNLNVTMEHHKHSIELAKTYNSKATQFAFAADDLEEEIEQPLLYQSVAEVQASIEALETKLRSVRVWLLPLLYLVWFGLLCSAVMAWFPFVCHTQGMNSLTLLYNEISGLAEQVHALGNTEAFSRYTVQALFERHEVVSGKLTARNEALQQSLGIEQTKEQLRLQFAEKAAAFKAHCDGRSAQITALEGDLETRILTIQKLHEEYCREVHMLEELQVLSNTLEEWGIINNSHTPETILSLRAVWDVLGKVGRGVLVASAVLVSVWPLCVSPPLVHQTYERMYEALRNQYLAEKSGQITPEQYQEIMDVMVYFDKDKDKCLNEVEFRNCITGLGLVVSDDTVASKLAASTTGERKLNFDEFAAFMVEMVCGVVEPDMFVCHSLIWLCWGLVFAVQLSEPGHTLAEVTAAFRDLADGRPNISAVCGVHLAVLCGSVVVTHL
jgi:hypothetical protein